MIENSDKHKIRCNLTRSNTNPAIIVPIHDTLAMDGGCRGGNEIGWIHAFHPRSWGLNKKICSPLGTECLCEQQSLRSQIYPSPLPPQAWLFSYFWIVCSYLQWLHLLPELLRVIFFLLATVEQTLPNISIQCKMSWNHMRYSGCKTQKRNNQMMLNKMSPSNKKFLNRTRKNTLILITPG